MNRLGETLADVPCTILEKSSCLLELHPRAQNFFPPGNRMSCAGQHSFDNIELVSRRGSTIAHGLLGVTPLQQSCVWYIYISCSNAPGTENRTMSI